MVGQASSGAGAPKRKSSGVAIGFTVFAGIFLTMVGFFHLIEGVVELTDNNVYSTTARWAFRFGVGSWGWIHVIFGIVVIVAGMSLFSGAVWARTIAVIAASLSILASFMWLPYYPLWAIVVIALDITVIWAVTLHGRDTSGDFDDEPAV